MILTNITPELHRLRAALRIEWLPYRSWMDANFKKVQKIIDCAEPDEEMAPLLRAQYIHDTWPK